ncbi:MAG: hypothetical protein K0Q79_210 [Flavipsychrobacter sp.]|jgi:hypothetical protein|nr:hypothetical protein [Flavipsychrobacter sp.]
MKRIILVLLIVLWAIQVSAQHTDTPNFVVLYDKSGSFGSFPKKSVSSVLTQLELTLIEHLLRKCIDDYNFGAEKRYNELKKKNPQIKIDNFIIRVEKYKRQYVVKKSLSGEKLLCVNCFCHTLSNYKKEIVSVEDGGNCYFNLMINLTKGQCYDLMVNGEA